MQIFDGHIPAEQAKTRIEVWNLSPREISRHHSKDPLARHSPEGTVQKLCPGSHRHINPGARLPQAADIARPMLSVRVERDHVLTARMPKPCFDSRAVSEVVRMLYPGAIREAGCQGVFVGRAMVFVYGV